MRKTQLFASVFSINGWRLMILEVPSNPSHSMILWSWVVQSSELEGSSDFPFAVSKIVRKLFYQLSGHKSMGPDRIHPWVLKELADVTANNHSQQFTKEGLWWAGCTQHYKQDMREDSKQCRPVGLTSVLGGIIIPSVSWGIMKDH